MTGSSQVQVESKQSEAAMCFYRAMQVHPEPEDLIGIYQKTVPKPILDALYEIIALDTAVATERITYSTNLGGEEEYFSKIGEKEAYFMEEVSRGDALCQHQDQDGRFVQTPRYNRMLMNLIRKNEDRSSNVLLQGHEGPPVTNRRDG